MFHSYSRRAFTLVELLVVIAIIGILVGLLLPAIQAAREAARRMQCSNNLKQLGLAQHNYHDVHKSFAPAYQHPGGDGPPWGHSNNVETWGWLALIMPFIEQGNMHNLLGVTRISLSANLAGLNPQLPPPQNVTALQTIIPSYVCPSDSNSGLVHQNIHFGGGVGTAAGGLGQFRPAVANYVGSRGTRNGQPDRPNHDPQGVLTPFRVSISDITDGTSNTFLAGERDTIFCRSGTWVGPRNPRGAGTRGWYVTSAVTRVPLNSSNPPYVWSNGGMGCGRGFSSMHTGGAQFVFCDGSVHFISDSIHYNEGGPPLDPRPVSNAVGGSAQADQPAEDRIGVYQRLSHRRDRFVIPGDF